MKLNVAVPFVMTLVLAASGSAQEAASIEYGLHEVRLALTVDVVLERCTSGGISMAPTLAIAPQPVRSLETERLSGGALASPLKRREVAISLHDNGTIKSLNGTTENRTAAVIGGIFKLAASIPIPKLLADPPLPEPCKSEIRQEVERVNAMKSRIASLRSSVTAATTPEQLVKIHQAVDALAREVAEARAGRLHIQLKKVIELGAGETSATAFQQDPCGKVGGQLQSDSGKARCRLVVAWEGSEFADWFEPVLVQGALARDKAAQALTMTLDLGEVPTLVPTTPVCKRSCPTVLVREPAVRSIVVTAPAGSAWNEGSGGRLASVDVAIGQWGQSALLPLNARFGQTRTVKLDFDQFGRKTSFGWGSSAGAEGVIAGLTDTAAARSSYRTATAGPTDLEQQQAEITELETLQKLNTLRACEEVIRAGGFTCPP